jgi:hypothetical protein
MMKLGLLVFICLAIYKTIGATPISNRAVEEDVEIKCIWNNGCGDGNPCEPGTYCYVQEWWSQCQELTDLPTENCFPTNNGPYWAANNYIKWGCVADSDCCNPSAKCGEDKLCTLPCEQIPPRDTSSIDGSKLGYSGSVFDDQNGTVTVTGSDGTTNETQNSDYYWITASECSGNITFGWSYTTADLGGSDYDPMFFLVTSDTPANYTFPEIGQLENRRPLINSYSSQGRETVEIYEGQSLLIGIITADTKFGRASSTFHFNIPSIVCAGSNATIAPPMVPSPVGSPVAVPVPAVPTAAPSVGSTAEPTAEPSVTATDAATESCLYQNDCTTNGLACEEGSYCFTEAYYSQCREDPASHSAVAGCIELKNGASSGVKYGCEMDSDCCNVQAKCGADKLCTLLCDGATPVSTPSDTPTAVATAVPTAIPTTVPTVVPTAVLTAVPTATPTDATPDMAPDKADNGNVVLVTQTLDGIEINRYNEQRVRYDGAFIQAVLKAVGPDEKVTVISVTDPTLTKRSKMTLSGTSVMITYRVASTDTTSTTPVAKLLAASVASGDFNANLQASGLAGVTTSEISVQQISTSTGAQTTQESASSDSPELSQNFLMAAVICSITVAVLAAIAIGYFYKRRAAITMGKNINTGDFSLQKLYESNDDVYRKSAGNASSIGSNDIDEELQMYCNQMREDSIERRNSSSAMLGDVSRDCSPDKRYGRYESGVELTVIPFSDSIDTAELHDFKPFDSLCSDNDDKEDGRDVEDQKDATPPQAVSFKVVGAATWNAFDYL